jgi:hypothetical protein
MVSVTKSFVTWGQSCPASETGQKMGHQHQQ